MSERSVTISEPLAGELIVINGPDEGVSRSLLVPVTLIGSNENCDLRILDLTVRAVHCVVSITPEGPHLRSVGGTTFVNNIPVSARLLANGDIVTVGPLDLELHWRLPPGPEPNLTAAMPRPRLTTLRAEGGRRSEHVARRSASRQAG